MRECLLMALLELQMIIRDHLTGKICSENALDSLSKVVYRKEDYPIGRRTERFFELFLARQNWATPTYWSNPKNCRSVGDIFWLQNSNVRLDL